MEFPAAFGQRLSPEELKIRELDALSGASLKLTLLNPDGIIWNMVAGGGASVIYADTVCDLGFAKELAMYGEYSGNPSTNLTYEYAKVLLDLMTRKPDPQGRPKTLILGGGIANFTDVAKTFTGIIQALNEYADKLKAVNARVFVRRGGPNYEVGLVNLKKAVEKLGVPIEVHGPEYHMTRIVSDAFKS
jgi:ATP-citrate lyase beta-subunit